MCKSGREEEERGETKKSDHPSIQSIPILLCLPPPYPGHRYDFRRRRRMKEKEEEEEEEQKEETESEGEGWKDG